MSDKTRGLALTGAGALLVLIAVTADVVGLGGYPGFGWKQILCLVVGAGVVFAGLRDLRR
jgi:hypothetical protein